MDNKSAKHAKTPTLPGQPESGGTDSQDGTAGFNPQLGGHGKANHSQTSSFDAKQKPVSEQ